MPGQVLAAWMKALQQAPLCVTFQKLADFLQFFIYLYSVSQPVKMYGKKQERI